MSTTNTVRRFRSSASTIDANSAGSHTFEEGPLCTQKLSFTNLERVIIRCGIFLRCHIFFRCRIVLLAESVASSVNKVWNSICSDCSSITACPCLPRSYAVRDMPGEAMSSFFPQPPILERIIRRCSANALSIATCVLSMRKCRTGSTIV